MAIHVSNVSTTEKVCVNKVRLTGNRWITLSHKDCLTTDIEFEENKRNIGWEWSNFIFGPEKLMYQSETNGVVGGGLGWNDLLKSQHIYADFSAYGCWLFIILFSQYHKVKNCPAQVSAQVSAHMSAQVSTQLSAQVSAQAASKVDYSRPRQTIADQGRL